MWRATSVIVCAFTFINCASRTVLPNRLLDPRLITDQLTPRVRSESPAIRELIAQATERSATFERLMATIDRTDGIVYVMEGRCGHGLRACMSLTITTAGAYRFLRITIDLGTKTEKELMASIGHELQHAIEVLSDPTLTNNVLVYDFYNRRPLAESNSFETRAAVQAGLSVTSDLDAWERHSR